MKPFLSFLRRCITYIKTFWKEWVLLKFWPAIIRFVKGCQSFLKKCLAFAKFLWRKWILLKYRLGWSKLKPKANVLREEEEGNINNDTIFEAIKNPNDYKVLHNSDFDELLSKAKIEITEELRGEYEKWLAEEREKIIIQLLPFDNLEKENGDFVSRDFQRMLSLEQARKLKELEEKEKEILQMKKDFEREKEISRRETEIDKKLFDLTKISIGMQFQQKDMEYLQKDFEFEKKDLQLEQKGIDIQYKSIELQQMDMQTQKRQYEISQMLMEFEFKRKDLDRHFNEKIFELKQQKDDLIIDSKYHYLNAKEKELQLDRLGAMQTLKEVILEVRRNRHFIEKEFRKPMRHKTMDIFDKLSNEVYENIRHGYKEIENRAETIGITIPDD